jgi:hypothetical protein
MSKAPMGRWWRAYSASMNDPKIQTLPGEQFKAAFFAALNGEQNEFSGFIRPGRDRPSGPAWASLRSFVFKRDDYTCQYCGERGERLECDHVIPVSRNGSNDPENLVTACKPCNRSKRDKTPEEWLS